MENNKTIQAVPQDVRELFAQFANDLIRSGWKHYSADAILHRIRWHYHVEIGNREFKCNNDWTAYLARWWLKNNPEHPEFFELRALACERFLPPNEPKEQSFFFGERQP
jgi:hypothetical protein